MSILLAAAGGLLSGIGQGIDADVAQLVKERAADLANEQQMKVIATQQQGAKDLQGSQQAFQAEQSDKNHAWDQTYQSNAQAAAAALADKNISAQQGLEQQREGFQAAQTKAANDREDEPDVIPTAGPMTVLGNGNYGYPQTLNGVTTLVDTGQKAPLPTKTADPALGPAMKAGSDPINGGFNPQAATAAYNWAKGVTTPAAAPAPAGAPAGGGAPAPNNGPSAPPQFQEGAVLKQGNGLFKVVNGQPVYQGPAQ